MWRLLAMLGALRAVDRTRRGFPGEHLATFGAGAAVLRWAGRSRSPLLRSAAMGAGAVLLIRALSGRDGVFGRKRREVKP